MAFSKFVLISGGAGFIGKNLIKKLLETNSNIIVLDNFISSNRPDFFGFCNELGDKKSQITTYHIDICDSKAMTAFTEHLASRLLENGDELHEIYHLASIASPPLYKKYPLQTLDVGYIGTKNMLELAKKFNSKLLFSSTSEVYGDPAECPQNEDYYGNVNTVGERSSYDESKRVAESLCYTYNKSFNIDVKIARIFNTYGPLMSPDDGRIITEIIGSLVENRPLTIYGDGTQTRSYCYVDDTVDMLIKLMSSDVNEPVNIGNDFELSINDTYKLVQEIFNETFGESIEIEVEYKPLTRNDPMVRRPCLKRNRKLLGEREFTSFQSGIRQMIEWSVEKVD